MSAPSDEFQDSNVAGAERHNQPDTVQDDYVSRTGQKDVIPVTSDKQGADAGGYADAAQADSDQQLQADERDAIDQSNVISERTRGATKDYTEPGDTVCYALAVLMPS